MHRSSTFRRVSLGLAGALPLLAAGLYQAGSASAAAPPVNATVAVGSTGLVYTGLSGPNDVGVNIVGGRFVITDSAPITAGTGCLPTAKGVFEVTCQVPLNPNGTPKTFRVAGGNGDDVVRNNTTLIMRADGGQGNDFLVGGSATDVLSDSFGRDILRGGAGNDNLNTDLSQADGLTDTLEGGAGDDDLRAGPNKDVLRGQTGNDTLRGGLGGDDLDGGSGTDSVAYLDNGHNPFDRLVISIDANADDGLRTLGSTVSQEGDFVRTNIENVFAGHGNDVIFGSASANVLHGNLGNDVIEGGLGQDTIDGGPGNDTLASNKLFGVPVADGAIDTVNGNTDTDHCRVPFVNVEADITIACETVNQD